MNRAKLAAIFSAVAVAFPVLADYNVVRPSEVLRPRWTGAEAGEWTMDCDAAFAAAKAAGKCTILFNTGSWWCPHCQAFEKKVILSDEWENYIAENGFYLAMLDFPYRMAVKEEELWKSKHPELGPGWGFQCWLYDDAYLAENGLSAEDGLREIMKRYEIQKDLAPETASQVTIGKWDGSGDFTYGKVGYPTLIVYLPDGTEAGRFVPFVTNMDAEEARPFVINQLETIIAEALDSQCGLCSDPETGGLDGTEARAYRGWLAGEDEALAGIFEAKTGKAGRSGSIKIFATVKIGGKKIALSGSTTNGYGEVTLRKSAKRPEAATLRFGDNGLLGTFTDGVKTYPVIGARDVFRAKDESSRKRAEELEQGTWSFVIDPTNAPSAFAKGYGAFTVKIQGKGRARFTGKLGDGTKVAVNGNVIAGEDGVFCLPLIASVYSGKKGGFSCNLWFKNGWLFNVTAISPWKAVGKHPFVAHWKPIYSATSGYVQGLAEMELSFRDVPDAIAGMPLAEDPDLDLIGIKATKWTGTGLSGFSARCNSKTGVVSGSMKFKVETPAGKIKPVKASVYGILVGDAMYGSALVSREGSWAIKMSSCGACED